MKKFDYEKVESVIGYHFTNRKLLKQAFFRSSFAHENGRESNEVLEFIGDKVLDLAVMRILLEKYSESNKENEYFRTSKQEGELTKIKSELVSTSYLANSFDNFYSEDLIYYGKSDLNNKVTDVMSIKEDAFEAVIGAIALDSKWNIEKIIKVVKKLLNTNEFLKKTEIDTNFVGILQEYCVSLGLDTPNYALELLRQNDSMVWHATCKVKGIKQSTNGLGFKQKEAKKEAAEQMIQLIKSNEDKLTAKIALMNREEVFASVNSYVQAGVIEKPSYEFEEFHDDDGNPCWKCAATVEELGYIYFGYGSTKKEAQMQALIKVLKELK